MAPYFFSCLSCFKGDTNEAGESTPEVGLSTAVSTSRSPTGDAGVRTTDLAQLTPKPKAFSREELAAAVNNFNKSHIIGEGGFGCVYKGRLQNGQDIAVKKLNRGGLQGEQHFEVEVKMLSRLHHLNLVKLLGYCIEGGDRLLVYDYMPLGSLDHHLFIPQNQPRRNSLDWNTRLKIAAGAARGLEYLHDKVKPQVLHRDIKPSNILLNAGFHPMLSDFGIARDGPADGDTHVTTVVLGTVGHVAPEYLLTRRLSARSDVYSFGVVLLQLITGRKVVHRHENSQLLDEARAYCKDKKGCLAFADKHLQGYVPPVSFWRVLSLGKMCTQDEPHHRPVIRQVAEALEVLVAQVGSQERQQGAQGESSGS